NDTTATQSVAKNLAENAYSADVEAGNTYYWRIESRNIDGIINTGPVWRFRVGSTFIGHMYNVAGTGSFGFGEVSQQPLDTQLYWPQDIAFDANGKLVVVDWNNHRVL